MKSVIKPQKAQKDRLISSLVAAFLEYPLFSEVLEDFSSRAAKLHVWVKLVVTYGYKFASIYSTSEESEGVMVLLDTINHGKESDWRWILSGVLRLFLKWSGTDMKRYNLVIKQIDRLRAQNAPRDHIYLMLLGVNPAFHKQGYARQLLNRAILRSEEEKLPLYLETFKPINEIIYNGFGFETIEKFSIPNSTLTLYSMLRKI